MGSKSPSTPDIRPLPATQAGGLRRNDGSIVPIPEGMTPTITPMPAIPRKDPRTTGGGRGFPSSQNVPTMEQFGQTARLAPGVSLEEAYNNFLGSLGGGGRGFPSSQNVPTMEQFGQTVRLAPGVSLQEAYNNAFGPLAIQSPDSTAGIMSGLSQVPAPPGAPTPMITPPTQIAGSMIPERGPLGPRPRGGVVPRPPGPGSNAINQAQKQFGQYGFDEDVMNFLAGNIQRGYIDLGMNIGYNPETEMFSVSGGRRPGPTTNYTLDQFTNQFINSSAPSTGTPQPIKQPPLGPRPRGGVVPRPPGPGSNAINQAQKQFGQYGFDEDVMNFLAGNIQRGYIDLGMNIGYNPETEMFSVGSGGMLPGPTTNYTLDQFTNQFIGSSAPSTGTPQPIKQPPMSPGEILNPIKNPAPIQTPIGVPQPINQPPMELINPIRPGIQQPFNQPPIQTPIGGTPLPAPIQPTNPVTGNTSPIGGSQQDFDAYMNSYVNNLINQRMKNVFGGIMNALN